MIVGHPPNLGGRVGCAACEFGLLFRSDDTGDEAMHARCVPGRYSVELVKQIHNRNQGPESLWRGRSVVQRYHFTPSAAGRYDLRIIAYGPNIEFNVDGRLAISELSLPRRRGRLAGRFRVLRGRPGLPARRGMQGDPRAPWPRALQAVHASSDALSTPTARSTRGSRNRKAWARRRCLARPAPPL